MGYDIYVCVQSSLSVSEQELDGNEPDHIFISQLREKSYSTLKTCRFQTHFELCISIVNDAFCIVVEEEMAIVQNVKFCAAHHCSCSKETWK